MPWQSPDYTEILEQRLREARLDLLEDPRLSNGLKAGPNALDPKLVARVVRDKISAEATYGYDGIESSLRADAQQAMTGAGLGAEVIRQTLEDAARLIALPSPPDMRVRLDGRFSPSVSAAIAFGVSTVISLSLYQMMGGHPLLLFALIALGGIPALIVRNARSTQCTRQRSYLLDEYPTAISRHYVEVLEKRITAYEDTVNKAIDAKKPLPPPAKS